MRVLMPAVSAASELSGVQRHAFGLAACLLRLPEISRVDMVVAPWQANIVARHAPTESPRMRIHFEDVSNTVAGRNAWFYYGLPCLANALESDLIHASYPVPLRHRSFRSPIIVTLHDLYPYEAPHNFGLLKALVNRRVLQQCLRGVEAIACVSDATLSALRHHTTPPVWRKARRIYNTVEFRNLLSRRPATLAASSPFLLCVAQHRYNKNIELAIHSFHRIVQQGAVSPSMSLALVGIRGPETPRILRLIQQLGLDGRVLLAEGLLDEELLWCYEQCSALVMPSHTEGFGLPAVEALQVGCKVVCSDIPALREVGDTHCKYVPLNEHAVAAFADAIVAILSEGQRRPIFQPQFSVGQIAREYGELYRDVLTASVIAQRRQGVAPLDNSPASGRWS
jgi:glycosyltransferase involved in cell wall biosynthesis